MRELRELRELREFERVGDYEEALNAQPGLAALASRRFPSNYACGGKRHGDEMPARAILRSLRRK
jgi:hypothetical protein